MTLQIGLNKKEKKVMFVFKNEEDDFDQFVMFEDDEVILLINTLTELLEEIVKGKQNARS